MSRKTIPLLIASISVLLIALVVIIVVMLSSPEVRRARDSRSLALKTLLSRSPESSDRYHLNLNHIAFSLRHPFSPGGSLDNLNHFLSKDPGRREFAGSRDRRRYDGYISGDTGLRAEEYTEELSASGFSRENPEWSELYIGTVRAPFDEVKSDILIISGVPESLTALSGPKSEGMSITQMTQQALDEFAINWLPRGETRATYPSADREKIRDFLLGNKRFGRRMEALDNGWKELTASLYNLSANPRWKIAVRYYPELESELNELTTIVLASDIYRRNEDMMKLIPGAGPGIVWLPELSFYKNIPELTGQLTSLDPEDVTIFFVKVNLGYSFRDGRTQTWLNRRKDWLTDYFNMFFSEKTVESFSAGDFPEWRMALLKGEGLNEINKKMVLSLPFGKKKVYGVRELALVKVNLLTNP